MRSEVFLMDCMEGMKKYPDKYFELAIVDPPYFDGPNKLGYYGERVSSGGVKRKAYKKIGTWSIPDESYFIELSRVSIHQIIWGCNYYQTLYPTPGRIVWDKVNDSSTFSDCEIASCSLIDTVRIFRFMWNGMLQGKSVNEGHIMQGNKKLNEKRIHPTQKPVALYKWLLSRFAQKGDKILDTHVGSGSLRIAAYQMGFDFIGFEIDQDYFSGQEKRFNEQTAQGSFFHPKMI